MVASLRQILMVLLVLLQIAAPLVHAHVGGDGGMRGLHLHAFHNFRADAEAATAAHEVVAMAAIVELGSAIQVPQSADDVSPACLFDAQTQGGDPYRNMGRINFSPHSEPDSRSPFLTSHTSRAPPL